MPSAVTPLSTGPIAISDAKYADLQSLCTSLHVPVDYQYHPFYNLLHTGAAETANTDSISDCENEGVCTGDNSQAQNYFCSIPSFCIWNIVVILDSKSSATH